MDFKFDYYMPKPVRADTAIAPFTTVNSLEHDSLQGAREAAWLGALQPKMMADGVRIRGEGVDEIWRRSGDDWTQEDD